MHTQGVFSRKSDEWETPQEFYNKLDEEFHFTLDPCCTKENHKCDKFFTKYDDGLKHSWMNETVFVNPPYSECAKWVFKSWFENFYFNATVVMLLPARTDTKWFHQYIYGTAEIRFIKGRLKFSNSKDNAPFPSMVVIYRKE